MAACQENGFFLKFNASRKAGNDATSTIKFYIGDWLALIEESYRRGSSESQSPMGFFLKL